jgi:outer membrane protein TolC
MKKLLIITFMACFAFSQSFSQRTFTANTYNPKVDSVAEGLVRLAMNNPQIKSADNLARSQYYNYTRSKTLWMNQFTVAGNLNEYSIQEFNSSAPYNGNTLYPRYNIGVVIPLGIFVNSPKLTKSENARYQAGLDDADAVRLAIRRSVLLFYEEYLMNKKLVAFQQEVLQDARILFSKYEEKFQKGEATLEVYTIASKSKNTEEVRFLNVERDLKSSETQIEALIGMRLNDALAMIDPKK